MELVRGKKYLVIWKRPAQDRQRAFVGIFLGDSKHFHYFKVTHRSFGLIKGNLVKLEEVADDTPCGIRRI